MGLSSGIAFSYWWWVEHCYAQNGWYPYPLFELLSPLARAGLFVASAVLMTASTVALKWTYGLVNGWGPGKIRARPAREDGEGKR